MSKLIVNKPPKDNNDIYVSRVYNSYKYANHYTITFSVVEKLPDGDYIPVFSKSDCRSYMGEALFELKNSNYYRSPNLVANYQFIKPFDYLKGNLHIGVFTQSSRQVQTFKENFVNLNKIEEEFNIPCSTYTILDDEKTVVIEGCGMWKDSCWKIQLYTFMIKTLFYVNMDIDGSYMKLVKDNYSNLFGNIKMKPEEEIFDKSVYYGDTWYRHEKTGFVSICTGYNEPMAEVLGISKGK